MQQKIKEEYIEAQILEFLTLHKVLVWHNDIKGFFNTSKGHFQKNKNNFIRPGISDIGGILPGGRGLAIEVKKPSEMTFFDQPIHELKRRFSDAQVRGLSKDSLDKYNHAIEQREYIDEFLREGGVAFYASSINEVAERMRGFDLYFT